MAPKAAREILAVLGRLEAGLKSGDLSALADLEGCLESFDPAQHSEKDLGLLGEALLKLKGRSEGQSSFLKIRERLSWALSRAKGPATPAAGKIDLTF